MPFDPESKGGVEATVKIAKADLVPSDANLLEAYGSFGELEEACRQFCARVNGRVHRETAAVPAARLAAGSILVGTGATSALAAPAATSTTAVTQFHFPPPPPEHHHHNHHHVHYM